MNRHILSLALLAATVASMQGADPAEQVWSARTESNGIGLVVRVHGMESSSWSDLMINISIINTRDAGLHVSWPGNGGWERLNLFAPDGKRVPPTQQWAESMGEVTRHTRWLDTPGKTLDKGQKLEGRLPIAKLFQTENPGSHILKVSWVQGERREVPYPDDPNLRIEVRLPAKLPAKPEDFTLVYPVPERAGAQGANPTAPAANSAETAGGPSLPANRGHTMVDSRGNCLWWLAGGLAVVVTACALVLRRLVRKRRGSGSPGED